MVWKTHNNAIANLLRAVLLTCALLHQAMGQSPQTQQTSNVSPQPVSLAHLYWHFLVYQNYLDTKAAKQEAQGKDSSWLRNHLQARLGFSDADFAPIRTSSVRLTAEVKALDAQAAAIKAAGTLSASHTQLKALTAQREADINAEIAFLKLTLSPGKIAALETFLKQYFSPKNMVIPSSSTTGQPAPSAVQ
jgi:hypothetical protein